MLDNVENQDIEFKLLWKDEYLKWICGFANAQGGKIYIGIDDGGLWVEFYFKNYGEKVGDKLGDKNLLLNKNRKLILNYIKQNPKISIVQLAKELNLSTTAIEKNIKYLKDNKYIKRIGSAKGGYWEIVENVR